MRNYCIFLLIVLLILAGCGTNDADNELGTENEQNDQVIEENDTPEGGEEQADEQAGDGSPLPDLEESKTVNMEIEGETQEIVVNLHHHEQLGLSTYVPEDMVVESDDQTFNVYTNFQGSVNKDARFFIKNQTEEKISTYLEGEGFTLTEAGEKAYDFSDKEFLLEKEGFIGRVATLSEHDETYSIGYYYPSEFADGFTPRSHIIVNELVWHGH
ncbi:hypothetical protein ACFSCX_15940 [Bacillus salitolerans]|uniref:Lipoprotein n=1 Tax=Bacillus salitolerans TaxID=1437434 RepID=A0ABW4LV81_9BACI